MSASRTPLSSVAAALASLVAMLGCCLPLPAVLAAGWLGAAAGWLPAARPYLLAAAVASLGFAFYRLYHRRYCEVRRPWWMQMLVWCSLAAVVGVAVFPERLANVLAGSRAAVVRAPGRQQPLTVLRNLAALREEFNAAIGQTRVIALFSPT